MKKTSSSRRARRNAEGLQPEYRFDYRKARPNRFASRYRAGSRVVVLDPDVAKVFTTPESVNGILRAVARALPPKRAAKRR